LNDLGLCWFLAIISGLISDHTADMMANGTCCSSDPVATSFCGSCNHHGARFGSVLHKYSACTLLPADVFLANLMASGHHGLSLQ
jgi:hypothetical protein